MHDGQGFEDALLDFFQPVVVLIEDGLGMGQIQIVFGGGVPRQLSHQLQITASDLIIRCVGRHARQAFELPVDFFLDGFGQIGVFQLLADFRDVFIVAMLAQGLLDGLFLLPQHVLALLFVHVIPRLFCDLAAQLGDAQLMGEDAIDLLHQLQRRLARQYGLLLLYRQIGERCDAVHLNHRIGDVTHQLLVYLIPIVGVVQAGDTLGELTIDV